MASQAAAARVHVLGGYRRLLRASQQTFGADKRAVVEARKAVRAAFLENRDVHDTQALSALIKGIDEAEAMLLYNIVQGKANEKGTFEVKLTDPQKSRIRKDEELTEITPDSGKAPVVTKSCPDGGCSA
ncbi:hypothetical protein H310_09019 [Aphanomyces invadans]|uniref:Complex 1 LYR protein domain-containing protein n=1 Tax=Aphanomyces invadans TaxID=157072 RepID=A0A024TWF5_9STRA|nr:hypothetical protein H310_09019 [Aphanomyces invadans]ETV98319.1 hypothetical protein H310_09019 [Aphanomyces invadans]RHY28900.1 hypothetical protein DYB32_005617 [Aphanomyces invadans]|eukprot:XP_008873194.1 hypothetical protein H310_09019 [Aphanomyces invadans]